MWGDISIARRMSVIMAAVIAGMVLVGIVSLVNGRNDLVRDREQQVQRLVESAVGVLAHFQKEAAAGRMAEADAQDAALAVLRDVRYGNKDYFFVYQYDGLCRMQAADPKLEGQNRIGVTDVQGVPYVRDIVTAASQGGGFVRYSFPRLGADKPSPKLGYAAGFEPWKWAVVTAIYVDDIEASFQNRVWQFGGIVLAIIVVVGGVVVAIGRGITGPLTAITGAMTRLAGGDLSAEIPASARKDEIGAMARAVQVFKDHGREIESLRLEQQRAGERAEAERKRTMAVLADSFEKEVMDVVGDVTLSAQKMDAASSSMSSEAEHGNELAASVAAASVQASANVQTVASATEELSA